MIWASLVMTALVLFVKPIAEKWARKKVEQTRQGRSRAREQLVQFLVVLALAGGVWVATLMLTGVNAGGSWFWAFVLPPIIIAIGWWVYALISDRIEAKAGELYDRLGNGKNEGAPASPSAAEQAGRAELKDGLTPEQRKMLNDL